MNRPAAFFATTTALLAVSTIYLYRRLESHSAAPASASAPAGGLPGATSASTTATSAAQPATGGGPGTDAAASRSVPAEAASPRDTDVNREMMTPYARDFLRQYENPALRPALLRAARAGLESQYARLRDKLQLDAGTFDQLLDLLTEEQVDGQAGFFRCFLDKSCDTAKMPPLRDRSDEYLALLGGDKLARFNAFRSALTDWQSVVQLRGRLPESIALTDAHAERLLDALSAERERYAADAKHAGVKLSGWGNGTGTLWYSGDGGPDEQLASATQYSQRLSRTAATVLSADQLRAFGQLQQELLAGLASYLHAQKVD